MGDVYTNPPQSRNEAILRATIDGTEYTAPPQSRIEDLLLELKEAIEQGGTGEGDMKKSIYDSDNSVASAGGIKMFVNQKIGTLPQRVGSLETTADVLQGEVVSIENTLGGLGTASTKNSTSVVTDSSDLVESGAVEQALRDAEVVEGKNKLQNKATSSGIFTVNSDGTITANGTPTSQELINLGSQSGFNGNYILTGLDNTFPNRSYITVRKNNIWTNLYIRPDELLQLEFNLISTDVMEVFCVVSANTAITNKVFKPMLRKATETDPTYEPYYVPLKDVVPNKCDNSVIAPTENGTTASQAYAVGEHFIKDGQFKEVTQAIASGGAISDSNTVDKPIADLLKVEEYTVTLSSPFVLNADSKLCKYGRIVLLSIRVDGVTISANSTTIIGSIPNTIYPKSSVNNLFINYGNKIGRIFVTAVGEIKINSEQALSDESVLAELIWMI